MSDRNLIDDDGYPTEEALIALQNWTDTPRNLINNILDPIFCRGAGITVEETRIHDRDMTQVSLVTGGWSGCETAIGVIERSMLGCYWEASHRGGLHVYNIPTDDYDRPMRVLPDLRPLLPYDTRTVLDALMNAMKCRMNEDEGECFSCGSAPCGPHGIYYYCETHDGHERDNAKDTCGYALMLAQHTVHASRNIPSTWRQRRAQTEAQQGQAGQEGK